MKELAKEQYHPSTIDVVIAVCAVLVANIVAVWAVTQYGVNTSTLMLYLFVCIGGVIVLKSTLTGTSAYRLLLSGIMWLIVLLLSLVLAVIFLLVTVPDYIGHVMRHRNNKRGLAKSAERKPKNDESDGQKG